MSELLDIQQESENSTISTASNFNTSEITTDIQQAHPGAEIYTGTITSSFLYKRRFKKSGDHSTNEDHSYWWLTIKTLEGELISYNISSEDKEIDSLKKGDLISFIITKPYFLTHPLKIKKDKKIVKNDILATTVVFHRQGTGFYIIDEILEPSLNNSGKLFGVTFFIFFALLLLDVISLKDDGLTSFFADMLKMNRSNWHGGLALGVLAGLWIFIWLLFTVPINKYYIAKYEKALSTYNTLKSGSQKLLTIFRNFQTPETVKHEFENGASISSEGSIENIENSFSGLRNHYDDQLIYRHVLSANEKGTAQAKTYIAKVINKDLSVEATKSKSAYTQKTTTTYRDREYGYKVGEKHKYRDFSHTTRSSEISGSIEVLTSEQETFEVNVPTDALRSIDVGDYLLLGETYADIDEDNYHMNELTYNINKDIKTKGATLASYGSISTMSQVIMTLVFVGILAMDYLTNFNQKFLMIVFLPFLGGVIAFSCINILRNKHGKNKFLKVINTAYKTCIKNRREILESIE